MSTTEPVDHDEHDDDDDEEYGSWDAFWDETLRQEAAERGQEPSTTIRGIQVRIPVDLPLGFEEKLRRARAAYDEATFKQLLQDLFGVDVLDAWFAAGMGEREYQVVLTWGISCGRGRPISFREAYERFQARQAPGKAAAETTSTRPSDESDATGGSSKPTSAGNTSSRRKR
ncbi:hypothetical protein AB0K05_24935 [Nonomuraea sp. NPDC049486]|uniref:hypothetical protein n=1 Tax=Nonomuraea sp. NPDC049486 TaxID=3155773 RepID=UPI00341ED7C1